MQNFQTRGRKIDRALRALIIYKIVADTFPAPDNTYKKSYEHVKCDIVNGHCWGIFSLHEFVPRDFCWFDRALVFKIAVRRISQWDIQNCHFLVVVIYIFPIGGVKSMRHTVLRVHPRSRRENLVFSLNCAGVRGTSAPVQFYVNTKVSCRGGMWFCSAQLSGPAVLLVFVANAGLAEVCQSRTCLIQHKQNFLVFPFSSFLATKSGKIFTFFCFLVVLPKLFGTQKTIFTVPPPT